MKKNTMFTTIRGKIILCTAGITLVIAAVTVSICFLVFQSFLRRNQIQSAEYNLQVVSNNVASDMENIIYFSDWCRSNLEISQYLEAFQNKSRMPAISSQDAALRITALGAYSRLKEEYNTHHSDYLISVVVSPNNCRNYLLISDTAAAAAGNVAQAIHDSDSFQTLYEASDYLWLGFQAPLYRTSSPEPVLPIVRPVYRQYNSEVIGWTYLAISDRIIKDYLSSFPAQSDTFLYITVGGHSYSFTDGNFQEMELNHQVLSYLNKDVLNQDSQASIIRLADGTRRRLVTCPLGENGWTISMMLSEQDFNSQNQVYLLVICGIVIIIILMGFLLAFTLNRMISQPVDRLSSRISHISHGDFSRDPSIEGPDELGMIGTGINLMSENVLSLMDRKVEDEKQKKDLEYQILQSQINPHFLYNTLNSIKWMATIQNAPGIAEMVTALARLMKNVSKGTAVQIPLGDELALVKDYMLIQQYRYGGGLAVEYDIKEEELMHCLIHRFTLQPLVENALFHGIEPKGCAGKIQILAEKIQTDCHEYMLRISVTDNGIGMSAETIADVLKGDTAPSTDFFRHLGISNVNKRIQYEFGPDYGISIESVPGEYTTMIILLPFQLDKGAEI